MKSFERRPQSAPASFCVFFVPLCSNPDSLWSFTSQLLRPNRFSPSMPAQGVTLSINGGWVEAGETLYFGVSFNEVLRAPFCVYVKMMPLLSLFTSHCFFRPPEQVLLLLQELLLHPLSPACRQAGAHPFNQWDSGSSPGETVLKRELSVQPFQLNISCKPQ